MRLKSYIRWSWLLLASIIIFAAVCFSLVRALTPMLDDHREQVEAWLSDEINMPAHIGAIKADWRGLRPTIDLQQVSITPSVDARTLVVGDASISIDLLASLMTLSIVTHDITLGGLELDVVKDENGHVTINDFSGVPASAMGQAIQAWLLAQPQIKLERMQINVVSPHYHSVTFEQVNLRLRNHDKSHYIEGKFNLHGSNNSQLVISSRFNGMWSIGNPADAHLHVVSNARFNARRYPEHHLDLQLIDTTSSLMLDVKANYFPLAIASWFEQQTSTLSTEIASALQGLKPEGALRHLYAQFDLNHSEPTLISLSLDFKQVSFSAWQKIPGMQNLSGSLQANKNSGTLRLNSQNIVADFPLIFRRPTALQSVDATVQWQLNADALIVELPEFVATTPVGESTAQMKLTLPHDGSSPVIELLADNRYEELSQDDVYGYLPVSIVPDAVVGWIDNAVKGSGPINASLILRGPLRDFPFDNNTGTFLIDANVEQAHLDYFEGWPDLKDMQGHLVFAGRSMRADIERGIIDDNVVKNLSAVIPKMSTFEPTILTVDGVLVGELQQGLGFIKHSPLEQTIGQRIAGLEAKGAMQATVGLQIPLSRPGGSVELPVLVKGNVAIKEGQIDFPAWNISADHIQGSFQFTEAGLYAEELKGNIFNYPAAVSIDSVTNEKKDVVISIKGQGQVDAVALGKYYGVPLEGLVSGEAGYQFDLSLDEVGGNQLAVTSDLQGITTDLGAPLAKKSEEKLPATFALNFSADTTILGFRLADKINGQLQLSKEQQETIIDSGYVHLGPELSDRDEQGGLWIDGNIKQLQLNKGKKLQGLFGKNKANSMLAGLTKNLQGVDVGISSVNLLGVDFEALQIELAYADGQWKVELAGSDIAGDILIPDSVKEQPIAINLEYLRLPELPDPEHNSDNIVPAKRFDFTDMPAIQFSCKNFSYANRRLGRVSFALQPSQEGVAIEDLKVRSQHLALDASGTWTSHATEPMTTLNGKLVSNDMAEALTQLDLPDNLVSDSATVEFSLNWSGSPFAPSVDELGGDLSVLVKNGRIEGLSKETDAKLGLGRLITLLSLESLPRRLQLDFSDLTHKGYSFDSMKGHFILEHGVAKTEDAFLDGTVAEVSMKGSIGLAKQNYDLELAVEPEVTSSLPVVATIAGGPIVGVAALVVDRAVGPRVKKITRKVYKVTGSWDDPDIISNNERLKRRI